MGPYGLGEWWGFSMPSRRGPWWPGSHDGASGLPGRIGPWSWPVGRSWLVFNLVSQGEVLEDRLLAGTNIPEAGVQE